jgi:nitrogenase molybdenum-iron protein alpha/beta subunit
MAIVENSVKAAAVNPLKMSQPLGAAYAFLGMNHWFARLYFIWSGIAGASFSRSDSLADHGDE